MLIIVWVTKMKEYYSENMGRLPPAKSLVIQDDHLFLEDLILRVHCIICCKSGRKCCGSDGVYHEIRKRQIKSVLLHPHSQADMFSITTKQQCKCKCNENTSKCNIAIVNRDDYTEVPIVILRNLRNIQITCKILDEINQALAIRFQDQL